MQFYFQYGTTLKESLDQLPWQAVEQTIEVLHQAWLAERQVFIMGNGGSAATASHVACDLGKNTSMAGSPRLRVMSLNDNMALFSAHANDNGYENIFAEQLTNFAHAEDIVIAISTSGNSPNVLKAIELAHSIGALTIGWCGYKGGKLAQSVHMPIIVPNQCIEQIEDIHLILGHIITIALRQRMREHVNAELRFPAAPESQTAWQTAQAVASTRRNS
jgi:D-sedoheptulose 7-phosphate isomerase